MELTGDLSDFALADILQILALSRKTGTLSLATGSVSGKIVVERGRITFASRQPGGTLFDSLSSEKGINPDSLEALRSIGEKASGVWSLESLIVESGAMSQDELDRVLRRHVRRAVGDLVALEKGRFGIELNQVEEAQSMSEVKLADGLDVGEVLLEAAKDRDEAEKTGELPAVSFPEWLGAEGPNDGAGTEETQGLPGGSRDSTNEATGFDRDGHGGSLLCSMLAELRSYSFEAEVSLLVMRYASEVATRGVLFVLREDEVAGLGQFGVKSREKDLSPDETVRKIRIPLKVNSMFDEVLRTGQPLVGKIPSGYWNEEILSRIGGANSVHLSVFLMPIICQNRPLFFLYGDNYPGIAEMTRMGELVALVEQASLALDKIFLERLISELNAVRAFGRTHPLPPI
jgi:Domain of unknown function (DUF4388)